MTGSREFWTEARVVLLRRLRDDGVSYEAIAAQLGVTRSAISGKVDRLGLAARERRPRGPRQPRPVLKRRIPKSPEPNSLASGARRAIAQPGVAQDAGRLNAALVVGLPWTAGLVDVREDRVPSDETLAVGAGGASLNFYPSIDEGDGSSRCPSARGARACSLLDLSEHTCRWPVGDPAEADFFFCGEAPLGAGPYCAVHRRLAYRPIDPKPMSDFVRGLQPQPDFREQPDNRFGQFAEWDVT